MSNTTSTAPAPFGHVMLEVGSGFLLLTHSGVAPILAFVLIIGAVYLHAFSTAKKFPDRHYFI